MCTGRRLRRDRRRHPRVLRADAKQVTAVKRTERDHVITVPGAEGTFAGCRRAAAQRTFGNEKLRQDSLQLTVCEEPYRPAIRAPERIARASRTRKLPRLHRGQRNSTQIDDPIFEVATNATCPPSGDTANWGDAPETAALGMGNWKLYQLGCSRRHPSTVQQHRSSERQGEGGGDNPAEPLTTTVQSARRHISRGVFVATIGLEPSSSSIRASAMSCSRLRGILA